MKSLLNKFINDESGATAIEYGLIAALIAVACVAAMTAVGTALQAQFTTISTSLALPAGGGGAG